MPTHDNLGGGGGGLGLTTARPVRLSRSPHPYQRQRAELQHLLPDARSSRRDSSTTPPTTTATTTDDERRRLSDTNSENGSEADDERLLKGLPAPRHRTHKGFRGEHSRTPSPLPTPAGLDGKLRDYFARRIPKTEEEGREEKGGGKAVERLRRKRRVELLRRSCEVAVLGFVAFLVLRNDTWTFALARRRELLCEVSIVGGLVALYLIRISTRGIPVEFDPAPFLYPLMLPLLVAFVLAPTNEALLPNIVLGISALPLELVPDIGNEAHWLLSCLPMVVLGTAPSQTLDILFPLHRALCVTLHYLTTTSLLRAELQLLSIALINLLILATSPQAIILRTLLWGGGIGVLITCGAVLKWGVALARVPKWRFRRAEPSEDKPVFRRILSMIPLTFGIARVEAIDYETLGNSTSPPSRAGLDDFSSAVGLDSTLRQDFALAGIQKRHTFPVVSHPLRSSKRTPSGRKKRSASSSVRPFFALTQLQAYRRKWLYATWVYSCVLGLIFLVIRPHVGRYALQGNEPVGWALAYLLGDLPVFRFEVVKSNLDRWIPLPLRHPGDDFCNSGHVERLRQASIGQANTRLVLSSYWLAIIIVGLLVVFRLSSIYEVDTRRKVFHFMMVFMLLPATYVDPAYAALALTLILAVFLLLDLFRASQLPPLSKPLAYFLTPYVDGRDLRGPVVISHIFLLIGCAIPLWLSMGAVLRTGEGALQGWDVQSRDLSMVSGVVCVGMGDAAASLIGRRWGRRKWIWSGGKSIEGSLAFASAVSIALVLAKAWLRIGGWTQTSEDVDTWSVILGKIGIAASVASLTEAVLTGGNDNVVVPVVLWLCVKGLEI